MTRHNLFTQFYLDKNLIRFSELLYCTYKHKIGRYNKVTLLVENAETLDYCGRNFPEYIAINIGKRANFNDFFIELEKEENKGFYNIICNTDIYFPDPIQINHFYYNHKQYDPSRTILALSRYDIEVDSNKTPFHRPDSQDSWVFYGNPSLRTSLEYGMGECGCDNRLAYDLQSQGFEPINPCTQVHTYHYHQSQIRNYLNDSNEPISRVPPPYKLLNPF